MKRCLPWFLPVLVLASAAAAANPAHVVSFTNNDQLRCRIAGLAEGKLILYPAVAPESRLAVDVAKIARVHIAEAGSGHPPIGAEELRLRDGAILYGKFTEIKKDSITFEADYVGPLTLPSRSVESLSRRDGKMPNVQPLTENHVVVTRKGDVLIGKLQEGPDESLSVVSSALKGSLRYRNVQAILFPTGGAPASRPAPKGKLHAVGLLDRAVLVGRDLSIKDDKLSLTLASGPRVSVPMKVVAELRFGTEAGRIGTRTVLAWGLYSDRKEEFPRTMAALKAKLPPGWKVVEDFSAGFDEAFKTRLFRSRALLICEMEKYSGNTGMKLASQLKPIAQEYLRRGGNIVLLGLTGTNTGFAVAAGLLNVQALSTRDNQTVPFTAGGKALARGVGTSFVTTNSTMFYRLKPGGSGAEGAAAWAGTAARTPIVARRTGRGWVVLMGMDYFKESEQTKTLLINALLLR